MSYCCPDLFIFYLCFRFRSFLIVKGLGQIDDSGSAERLVTRFGSLLALVGCDHPFTVQSVKSYSTSNPVYSVELDSSESVDSLLRTFTKFTRRRDPVRRPPELENASLFHSVTAGTRIRISLLRVSCTVIVTGVN